MTNLDFYQYPRGKNGGGTKHYDLSDRYYIFMAAQLFSD